VFLDDDIVMGNSYPQGWGVQIRLNVLIKTHFIFKGYIERLILTKGSMDVYVNEAHRNSKLCPQGWDGVKKWVMHQYCCLPGATVFTNNSYLF